MISIKGLEKRYGDVVAVSDLSFEVAPGEIVGLLGHNGAGKTTVMKVLTGFLEPTQGTVTVGGLDVTTDRIGVQRQIGYLPENAPLYPEMLVQEYLMMVAELRGVPAAKRLGAISDAVRATGLVEWLVRPISTLSKGYRQRVGLAQAILHRPKVLVLDEPTNGLDPVQILEIRALIKRLAQDTTILLSTHILSEIEAVCDRVLILINGVLATDAPLSELLATDEVLVAVAEGTKAKKALAALDGVTQVRPAERPNIDGFDHYRLKCTSEHAVASAVFELAKTHNWTLGAVAPLAPSLERVFRDLMMAHAESSASEASK